MLDLHQKKLTELCSNLIILSRFEKGMSNYTYLCQDSQTKELFVFRFPGKGSEKFVDFTTESIVLSKIGQLNITSEIIYHDVNGFKIANFIVGSTPTKPINYTAISETLKKIHSATLKLPKYNHLTKLNKYEKLCSTPRTSHYFNLQNSITALYPIYEKYCIYPAHNDAQINNFVIEQKTNIYYLLDWEFAAQNDYIYDIACFGNIDFNDALNLLDTYEVQPKTIHLQRLYYWRTFQCLQWHCVAAHKAEIGLDLNIDFLLVSEKYLTLAQNFWDQYNKY